MNRARTALKTESVSRVKLGGRGQITIPPAIVKRLRLRRGEELNIGVFEREKAIILAPRRAVPKEQEWYHTPQWQEMMREAFEDVREGRLLGPFESAAEFKQAIRARRPHPSLPHRPARHRTPPILNNSILFFLPPQSARLLADSGGRRSDD